MKVNVDKLVRLLKSPKPVIQKEDVDYGYRAMYDAMQVNPLYSYFTQEDIDKIREVALSADINANPAEKYRRLKAIMEPRGFYFIGGGTNRRAYACRYDPRVVAKVATDSVGISNNKRELVNQNVLKPYCSKIFEVSPCGTLAIIERVNPIKTQAEFQTIADEVFDVLEFKIRGNNIGMEDIGRRSFKNWGVRTGYGPVLLDYPTMYVIDKKRAFCCARTKSGNYCNGPLQYDDGFDNIVCSYCGAKYMSKSIAKTDGDKISELLYSASGHKDYNCLKGNDGIMKLKLHDLETGVIKEFDFEKNTCNYINTEIKKKQENPKSTSNPTEDKPLKVKFKDLDNEEERKQTETKVSDTTSNSKEDSEESNKKAKCAADRLAENLDNLTKTNSNEESVIYTFLNYMINILHHDDANIDWLGMNYELCKNIENYMDILAALINYLKKVRDYSKLEDYCDKDGGDVFLYKPVAESIDVVTNIIHDLGLAISANSTTVDINILKFYFEKSNKKYISQAHCYNNRAQEDKLSYEDIILQQTENGVIRQTVMMADSCTQQQDEPKPEQDVVEEKTNNNPNQENVQNQQQDEPKPEQDVVEEAAKEDEDDDIDISNIDTDSVIVLIPYSGGQKVARATLSEFVHLLCDTAPVKAAEFLGKNIELICAFRDYITTEKADELLIEENIDLSSMTKHSFIPSITEEKPDNTKSDKPKNVKKVVTKKKVSKNFNNIAPPKQDSDLSKF